MQANNEYKWLPGIKQQEWKWDLLKVFLQQLMQVCDPVFFGRVDLLSLVFYQ